METTATKEAAPQGVDMARAMADYDYLLWVTGAILFRALQQHQESGVTCAPAGPFVIDSAREGRGEGPYLKLRVADELVANQRGRIEDRDFLVLVRIPRETADRYEAEARAAAVQAITQAAQNDNPEEDS